MNGFLIQKQTQAEKDQYLIECFQDTGVINILLQENYSLVSGRKGSGKTALARYLEKKYAAHGIDHSFRISLSDISHHLESETRVDDVLLYILLRVIQEIYSTSHITSEGKNIWGDFLSRNGLQSVADYQTFVEIKRTNTAGFSVVANASAKYEYEEGVISVNIPYLIRTFLDSLEGNGKTLVFVDDLCDYLDDLSGKALDEEIGVLRDILIRLDNRNTAFLDKEKNFRFISCIRSDLLEFMGGSNINKIKNNTLELAWNEKNFCSLLIKRLPFYEKNREEALIDPVKSIKAQFPDSIFQDALSEFDTNRQGGNFYSYMLAISFNRPRDFLRFCYAMRDRLSNRHPATIENIVSAEVEYTDYLRGELRDELHLVSKKLEFPNDENNLNKLVDILSNEDGFGLSQLKNDLSSFMDIKASNKRTQLLIEELWRYGILGFREKDEPLISFKYIKNSLAFFLDGAQKYKFYLHRGLWWFAKKRRRN